MDDTRREGEAGHASDATGAQPGRRVPGYDDLVRIGSGGSSTVYRAVDVRHQRPVAIKVLDLDASSGSRRTAFQREIEAIGRVGSHPYIVTVLASGFTADNHPYLVLPLFEGGTFSRLIDENGPLTWAAAVDIGIKLCSALETVHRAGVVHRDVKPGNVFIGVTPEHPLLADFGISSTIEGERTQTETMAVTFGYTAPEVLDDERPTPSSDIYSLAMTIFRLIQGLHAYYADTPAAVMRKILSDPDRPRLSAGVPPAVASVVADGLAKDTADRPSSPLAMARRLQQVQVDQGLAPTPVVVAGEAAVVDRVTAAMRTTGVSGATDRPHTMAPAADNTSAAALEASLITAVQRGASATDHREGPERATPGAPSGPMAPGSRVPADIGEILAKAVESEHHHQPTAAHPADAGPATERPVAETPRFQRRERSRGGGSPSLDLPTVTTARKPRVDRDDSASPPPSGSEVGRGRRVPSPAVAAVVLSVVAIVAALVILYAG